MNDQDIRAKAHEIITDAVNAVFTTIDENGFPQSRTMWTACIDDDFTTYFVTGRNLVKVSQIHANHRVSMFWTKTDGGEIGWDYVLIKGEAMITDNQDLRDKLWNDVLAEYFAQGKTDPNYVCIAVKPKQLLLMTGRKYPLDKVDF